MKDYLKEPLTDEEKAYIYGIIKNTAFDFLKKYLKIYDKEKISLDDDSNKDIDKKMLYDYDKYDFADEILETTILKDISVLKPYTNYEKEKIVNVLENIAKDAELENYIAPLTFNEKLVVFLLYMEKYQVNEVAILLNVSRMAIWRRDKSIKKKINDIKENLKNG